MEQMTFLTKLSLIMILKVGIYEINDISRIIIYTE